MSFTETQKLPLPSFAKNAEEGETTIALDSTLGLNGTYYLNGPAKFHFRELSYNHWLDGDGMVTAIRFAGNELTTTSKFVRGRKYLRESIDNQPVFRTFGTRFDGDRLYRGFGIASPYNVSVFEYRDRLLAFGEQSLPVELDPGSLETVSPGKTFNFDRQLNEASPFSAHPKIDDKTGELLNFGIFFKDTCPLLIYYRFDSDGRLACRAKHEIELPSSLHDFAASENYVVFYLSPYLLDANNLIANDCTLSDSLNWQPQHGSRLLVLSRHSGDVIASVPIEGKYNLHTIDARESGAGLVLDVIEYDQPLYDQYATLPELFTDVRAGVPTRIEIDIGRCEAKKVNCQRYQNTPDFPIKSDDRQYLKDSFWVLGISNWKQRGPKFHNQLAHLSWTRPEEPDVWTAPSGWFMAGEPSIAPTNDGSRLLIAPLYDSNTNESHVGLFAPWSVSPGPIKLIKLGHRIPLGFHSSYYPAGTRPHGDRQRRVKT